jgi:hypothetical protein
VTDGRRAGLAADVVLLAALKLAVSGWVLARGFSHVSDDDYARTVIAQQFAHAPRLDPSGTSWLPLPFWLTGTAMALGGRSLLVSRVASVAFSAAAMAAPYAAFRTVAMGRAAALAATGVAMALPWNAWLGAAMVPECWAGALVGAALVAMGNDAARPWCACALLAASLCRYEAWPACAALAAVCALRVRQERPARRELAWACVGLAGIVGWMAWNAHAHGSPTHFLTRVRNFRQAIGAADVPLAEKVLGYPRSLVEDTPEAALLGAAGLAGMVLDPRLLVRWRGPMAASALVVAFLVVGDVRDGAPTHHAARALAPVWWVWIGCGVDAVATAWSRARGRGRQSVVAMAPGTAAFAAVAWLALLPGRWAGAPGESADEKRDAQIALGEDLARRNVEHVEVTPCSFEHFAVLAAWGRPEDAVIHERTGAPPTAACPLLVER